MCLSVTRSVFWYFHSSNPRHDITSSEEFISGSRDRSEDQWNWRTCYSTVLPLGIANLLFMFIEIKAVVKTTETTGVIPTIKLTVSSWWNHWLQCNLFHAEYVWMYYLASAGHVHTAITCAALLVKSASRLWLSYKMSALWYVCLASLHIIIASWLTDVF